MPSLTTSVGPQVLPTPAGALNSSLDDHVVLGLLGYLDHWLRYALDGKLAQQSGTSETAVKSGCTYPWNPATYFVRGEEGDDSEAGPFPALYVWWDGASQLEPSRTTLLWDARARVVSVAYVFEELVAPGGLRSRHGLLNAVDTTIWRALDRMAHPTYGYNGDPVGKPLDQSLSLLEVKYLGSQQGRFEQQVPVSNSAPGGPGEGAVVRGFPMLQAQVRVVERVNLDEPDITDALGDSLITISGSDGESKDTVEIMQRVLPSPDGSEE